MQRFQNVEHLTETWSFPTPFPYAKKRRHVLNFTIGGTPNLCFNGGKELIRIAMDTIINKLPSNLPLIAIIVSNLHTSSKPMHISYVFTNQLQQQMHHNLATSHHTSQFGSPIPAISNSRINQREPNSIVFSSRSRPGNQQQLHMYHQICIYFSPQPATVSLLYVLFIYLLHQRSSN
ncbi:uncharacterized protein [Eurosta solidaginis]|uniref:uncharacterized protein isoform X1 n=1 Tax=Eurosta solidaginis TaxID=178769 RepID=UPI003530826B